MDTHETTKGWEALEVKLKAKGLSAGEIEQARKSFYDGLEILTKLFLATHSIKNESKQALENDAMQGTLPLSWKV